MSVGQLGPAVSVTVTHPGMLEVGYPSDVEVEVEVGYPSDDEVEVAYPPEELETAYADEVEVGYPSGLEVGYPDGLEETDIGGGLYVSPPRT